MTPHPDKLFQDRLEHYRKAAPASAWDRIESGLDRKRRHSPWWKIAAGFFLLVATSTIVFQLTQPDNTIATADNKLAAKKEQESDIAFRASSDVSREGVAINDSSDVSRETSGVRISSLQSSVSSPQLAAVGELQDKGELSGSNHGQSSVGSPQLAAVGELQDKGELSGSNHGQSSVSSPQSAVGNGPSSIYANPGHQAETTIERPMATTEIINNPSPIDEASDSKGTSITYSAEEVNAKFLKKESTTEATTEKKNTSGFQKVIDLALELKGEGTVLGELREKKNELLSFTTPSNKREMNK